MVENPFGPVDIPGAPDLGPDYEREEMYDSFEQMAPDEQESFVNDLEESYDE